MKFLLNFTERALLFTCLICLSSCAAPQFIPKDLSQLKTPEELGAASRQAYQKGRESRQKKDKLNFSHAGIVYSDECLKQAPENPLCLYYNVLNRGLFVRNHIPNYQKSLRLMVAHCETLLKVDPSYENAGCYRIRGDIYAKVPSFSLSSDSITRDLDKSAEYLQQAVKIAPEYALNHLFLARTLSALDEDVQAKAELEEFDRLRPSNLDIEYPEWKKERDTLARKLQ
jgi:tetratricopeptide (TPR) repeat protein